VLHADGVDLSLREARLDQSSGVSGWHVGRGFNKTFEDDLTAIGLTPTFNSLGWDIGSIEATG